MGYLATIDERDATDATARIYDNDRSGRGYVANLTKTFSHRPAVYEAWQELIGAIQAGMDLRRYEVATLAAARQLRSTYCAVAHGQVLAEEHLGEQGVHDLVSGRPDAGLDPLDAAITRLAEKITTAPSAVVESDFDDVRGLGLGDDEILDVVLAVAARCFFSTVLEATGTRADHRFESVLSPALLAALTVGRPIAEA